MNSEEALIKIEEELYLLLPKGIRQELIEAIKQDLDKLEKLEKENKELKEAINILKEVSSLNCDKTLETERQFLRLTKEEYELLKEVFESVGGSDE